MTGVGFSGSPAPSKRSFEAPVCNRGELWWHQRRHQLSFQPAFEHWESVIANTTRVHLCMDGPAHPGRSNDRPRSAAKLREEIRSLDAFQNKPCPSVRGNALAGLRDGNTAPMSELQRAHLGVQRRGIEARAEQAEDLALLPGEHLGLAAFCDLRQVSCTHHLGGPYYRRQPTNTV